MAEKDTCFSYTRLLLLAVVVGEIVRLASVLVQSMDVGVATLVVSPSSLRQLSLLLVQPQLQGQDQVQVQVQVLVQEQEQVSIPSARDQSLYCARTLANLPDRQGTVWTKTTRALAPPSRSTSCADREQEACRSNLHIPDRHRRRFENAP